MQQEKNMHMQVVTPDVVDNLQSLSEEELVTRLLVRKRISRINEALELPWGDLEQQTGRMVEMKNFTEEEYVGVIAHYKAAGWKLGRLENPLPKAPVHPYRRTLTVVFCPPSCSIVGKLHPPRDPEKVYASPYKRPRFEGDLTEEEFLASLWET